MKTHSPATRSSGAHAFYAVALAAGTLIASSVAPVFVFAQSTIEERARERIERQIDRLEQNKDRALERLEQQVESLASTRERETAKIDSQRDAIEERRQKTLLRSANTERRIIERREQQLTTVR